jgi:hypothetical protein
MPAVASRRHGAARRNSNGNGVFDADDAALAGASVAIRVYDAAGSSIGSYAGTTDADGFFRTDWLRDILQPGARVEVTDLASEGFQWDPLGGLDPTDNGEDADGDGWPDQVFAG